jgi:heptaprenyl diphosphate synthase
VLLWRKVADLVSSLDPFALPIREEDLARLELCLRDSVLGEDAFLNEVASHLIQAGGKRLRPSLALAASYLQGDDVTTDILLGGVSVELVHLASLYHDDVMDEATRRRSVESVNARWGNLVAIVAGDFLLARAAEIAAQLGTEVAGLLAATLARLCEGQVAEVRAAFQIERDEDDYLRCISNKTAALMSTACRIGALTAGLNRSQIDDLSAFGEAFGMVFQIRDDVLDIVATEAELGKPPGQDLAEGIYTLPVQRALRDPAVGPRLRDLLGHPLNQGEREEARALVSASPAISAAHGMARDYARTAAAAAARLGDGVIPKALVEFGYNVVDDLQDSTAKVLAS